MIDLSTNLRSTANAGAPMVLRHYATGADIVDGDGNKATLLLLGSDSDVVKQCEREFQLRTTEIAKRTLDARISPEAWEQYQLDRVVAATTGWEHCAYEGEAEFSAELVRRFYRNEPWAFEQAQAFVDDRANFSGASKTS